MKKVHSHKKNTRQLSEVAFLLSKEKLIGAYAGPRLPSSPSTLHLAPPAPAQVSYFPLAVSYTRERFLIKDCFPDEKGITV